MPFTANSFDIIYRPISLIIVLVTTQNSAYPNYHDHSLDVLKFVFSNRFQKWKIFFANNNFDNIDIIF